MKEKVWEHPYYLNEHRIKALADALAHRTVNIDMTL